MRRKTYARMLVKRALELWESEGWTLRKVLSVNPKSPARLCAEFDADKREVRLYPKLIGEGDPPLALTMMHELVCHLVLQYNYPDEYHRDGSTRKRSDALWWERSVWAGLDQCDKDALARLIEAPEVPANGRDGRK